MKQVQCRCDAMVDIDVPEPVNVDADPGLLSALAAGTALSAACPRCGATVRAELPVRLVSASRGVDAIVLPELERLAVYRGKEDAPGGSEILLGYQELFERARMLEAGLDPRAVESLKYLLYAKAEEAQAAGDVVVLFNGGQGDSLTFHVVGLKEGEAGVVKIPRGAYDKAAAGLARTAQQDPYKTLFAGRYRSCRKLGFVSSLSDQD